MSTTEQPEQEVVTGTVAGIVQKAADKWQIEVNTGSSYPRKLWTKDAEAVNQLATMIGQPLSFMCGVSHWVNQQQQNVRSLWLNGFGPAGSIAAPPPQQQQYQQQAAPQQQWQGQPQQQFQPQTQPVQQQFQPQPQQFQQAPAQDAKQGMIHRQTASKVAVQLLGFLHPEAQTFATLIALSERLVGYYDNGAAWVTAGGQEGVAAGAEPGYTHSDDDIPF